MVTDVAACLTEAAEEVRSEVTEVSAFLTLLDELLVWALFEVRSLSLVVTEVMAALTEGEVTDVTEVSTFLTLRDDLLVRALFEVRSLSLVVTEVTAALTEGDVTEVTEDSAFLTWNEVTVVTESTSPAMEVLLLTLTVTTLLCSLT